MISRFTVVKSPRASIKRNRYKTLLAAMFFSLSFFLFHHINTVLKQIDMIGDDGVKKLSALEIQNTGKKHASEYKVEKQGIEEADRITTEALEYTKIKVQEAAEEDKIIESIKETPESKTQAVGKNIGVFRIGSTKQNQTTIEESPRLLQKNLCMEVGSQVCDATIVMERQNLTFCSAAKVASTAVRGYFLDIADGEVTVPADAKWPVHQANWTFLTHTRGDLQHNLVTGENIHPARGIHKNSTDDWIQILFVKHVVQRFVSGYTDKVLNDCQWSRSAGFTYHFYDKYGFDCLKHGDFEEFITFMETVPTMEGHFEQQSKICEIGRYPWTEVVQVDDDLNGFLVNLSKELGKKTQSTSFNKARYREQEINAEIIPGTQGSFV